MLLCPVAMILVLAHVTAGTAGASGRFVDDDDNPHEPAIEAVADAGFVNGCGPQRFCPLETLTRGQMVSMLDRALDLPATSTDRFVDDDGSVHEEAINRAVAAGVVSGRADGTYGPNALLSRGQIAAMLRRALDLPVPASDTFADDDGTMFEPDIEALVAAQITTGCTPDRFCPTHHVLRGQMATLLARAFGLRASRPPPGPTTTAPNDEQPSDGVSIIEGTLRDRDGAPVEGAELFCFALYLVDSENPEFTGRVQSDGTWRLSVAPDTYELYHWPCRVDADELGPPYLHAWYDSVGGTDDRFFATAIEVPNESRVSGIDARVPGGTVIEGSVFDVDGDPLEGVMVSVVGDERNTAGGGRSNIHGRFRIVFPATGQYRLSLYLENHRPVWYPDRGWVFDAPPVHVAADTTTTLTPITLVPAGDADGDGLGDEDEYWGHRLPDGTHVYTNILDPDSDADGVGDAEELAQGTDPSRP